MARKIGDKDIWVRTFEVTEPVTHKKGFTVYKVVSTVFPRSFPEGATKITIWKRYNDFKKLHKELELVFKQLYLKGEFPSFPKEKLFGRVDDGVIEERRKCALALLEFAAAYSQLFTNKVFLKFFETSYNTNELVLPRHESSLVSSSNSQGPIIEDDSGKQCDCLIPERVWKEKSKEEETEVDEDRQSLSSFTCSSPDPVPDKNSELVMTSSILTGVVDSFNTLPGNSGLSHSQSNQPRVTTFTDSSQIPVASSSTNRSNIGLPYSLKEHQEPRRNLGLISSASLTEDLDLLMQDESDSPISHSEKLLPNSASCLSLDTLTFQKPLRECKDNRSNNSCSGSINSKKKMSNGFGLFDFLPIFAKKPENEASIQKTTEEPLTPAYFCEAAGHFTVAHHHESNSEYDPAFKAYMHGIRILLEGAQCDTDRKRRMLVRKKIEKYLSEAEALKEKLAHENGMPSIGNHFESSRAFSSPRKKLQGLVEKESSLDGGFVVIDQNVMPSNIQELKLYKVVGCSFSNILIVVNTTVVGGPKCYAVKILRKSAAPLDPEKPTLIPCPAAFVVQLTKWFNTNDAVIMVLQYAGGGRLIDFVKTYQTKQISPVTQQPSPTYGEDDEGCSTFGNHLNASLEFSKKSVDALKDMCRNVTGNNERKGTVSPTDLESMMMPVQNESTLEIGKKNKSEERNECFPIIGSEKDESEISECSLPAFINDRVDLTERNLRWPSPLNESVKCVTEEMKKSLPKCDKDEEINCKENSIWSLSESQQSLPISFSDINSLNIKTEELIENSKVLIQTVSKTLLEQKEKPHDLQPTACSPNPPTPPGDISCPKAEDKSEGTSGQPSCSNIAVQSDETDSCNKTFSRPTNLLRCFSQILEDNTYNVPSKFMNAGNLKTINYVEEECLALKRMVPECCVKIWAAEIVLALEKLHGQGITYGDLDINNILLGENGHILLSYRALWNEVDSFPTWNEYSSPEVISSWGKSLWKAHPSADWWSLGAILFLLITGQTLQDFHPEGIHPQTVINVPLSNCCGDLITPAARTLLAELLQFSPSLRLGYYGAEEIKNHPFFEGFDWDGALLPTGENS